MPLNRQHLRLCSVTFGTLLGILLSSGPDAYIRQLFETIEINAFDDFEVAITSAVLIFLGLITAEVSSMEKDQLSEKKYKNSELSLGARAIVITSGCYFIFYMGLLAFWPSIARLLQT